MVSGPIKKVIGRFLAQANLSPFYAGSIDLSEAFEDV
jgi:hypothetical protein